jgi:anti-sigma factor RsiW
VITDCRLLNEHLVELVEGGLDAAQARSLRAHAATCPACARQLELEERLVQALRDVPAAPAIEVPVPDPEPAPIRRLHPVRLAMGGAAAAAAAILVVAALLGGFERVPPVAPSGDDVADTQRPVEILTVVESSDDAPLPDDGLLALTAGVEAVVMRRPAQARPTGR